MHRPCGGGIHGKASFAWNGWDDWVVTVADPCDTCLKKGPKKFLAPFCGLHRMD
jgi:hypothetical protein